MKEKLRNLLIQLVIVSVLCILTITLTNNLYITFVAIIIAGINHTIVIYKSYFYFRQ